MPTFILVLSCPDRPGVVAAVARHILECGGNILESRKYNDPENDRFFLRVAFRLAHEGTSDALGTGFDRLADELAAEISLRPCGVRPRVQILVSKFDHCLVDLLYRNRIGELDMEVVGIASNHSYDAIGRPDIGDIPLLSRAVALHLAGRVLVNGARTVVFRD